MENVIVIISRYNENLSWLLESPFNQLKYIVYNKGINNNFEKTNVIQIKTTTTKQAINQKTLMTYFVSNLHIPQDTIKTFVDQLPTKTVQTLSIKSKPA